MHFQNQNISIVLKCELLANENQDNHIVNSLTLSSYYVHFLYVEEYSCIVMIQPHFPSEFESWEGPARALSFVEGMTHGKKFTQIRNLI